MTDKEVEKYITVWICNCSELGEQTVMAVDDLQYLPLVEEKHGKWDDKGNCSACGKNVYDDMNADIWSRYTPPFCPNCGAKMDGKEI